MIIKQPRYIVFNYSVRENNMFVQINQVYKREKGSEHKRSSVVILLLKKYMQKYIIFLLRSFPRSCVGLT
jgi:hypothetical protein